MKNSILVLALLLLAVAPAAVNAFSPALPSATKINIAAVSRTATLLRSSNNNNNDNEDFPQGQSEEYQGDVDWDAEWKKVVAKESTSSNSGNRSSERPGKDFYKSETEIAAIRAANKAQTKVQEMSSKLPSVPSMNMQSMTGDWRFWIGILALISIGSAVLSAPPNYVPISGGDSYYI